MNARRHKPAISETAARRALGFDHPVPLSPRAMARSLRVTFMPIHEATDRVRRFAEALRNALIDSGVTVLDFESAQDVQRPSKLQEDLVVIAPGEFPAGGLPIDRVSNLRKTTIVGIVDGPCPAEEGTTDQSKLNSIVRTLGWYVVQTVIYVDDAVWTVCTMNGAVIPCAHASSIAADVLSILVPKMAAPVVPPHASDFEVRAGALDLAAPEYAPYIGDFVESGPLWLASDLFLFHTSLESLEFRSPFYKRVVAAYLDHRSGMSYGFLARQMAVRELHAEPATGNPLSSEPGTVLIEAPGGPYHVRVPDVWVFTTRSGCDKAHLDPRKDILRMGLSSGRIIFETPKGLDPKIDCRPSYDTLTILAHALGNALAATVLRQVRPDARLAWALSERGLALAHWHGYVRPELLPAGTVVYGAENPPVSCSTHQAALFALTGKLEGLRSALVAGMDVRGDLHIEPHHGVNMTGESLTELARWALQTLRSESSGHRRTATGAGGRE